MLTGRGRRTQPSYPLLASSPHVAHVTSLPQILVGRPGAEEASNQGGPQPGAGDMAGVPGLRGTQCHQRGLQELRKDHPECQRPRPLRLRGRAGQLVTRWIQNKHLLLLHLLLFYQ